MCMKLTKHLCAITMNKIQILFLIKYTNHVTNVEEEGL